MQWLQYTMPIPGDQDCQVHHPKQGNSNVTDDIRDGKPENLFIHNIQLPRRYKNVNDRLLENFNEQSIMRIVVLINYLVEFVKQD